MIHALKEEELKLNNSQTNAIVSSIAFDKPINFIQGPPGTGKTTVKVSLINSVLYENNKIKI